MTPTYTAPVDPNLTITIRPDDIEFRCGNSTDKNIPVMNLAPYVASVTDANGTTPYNVPQHDRFARWLHEITADKIIRSPQNCVDLGLIFPYGTPGTKPPAAPTNTYTGPLSSAGITTSMGNVAERPDIGLLPEWEAYWMRTGIAGPMLAASKGFDSMPIWIIDERTGRFWDLITHPNATMFWRASGQPDFIASAPPGQWSMDMAHAPAIYCSYLATGGIRHLERLQALANWGFLETNYYVSLMGFPICSVAQTRKFAWHLRLLFMAWKATVIAEQNGPVQAPCLPSTYWKQHLDNMRAFIAQKFINDPALQTFKFFPDVTSYRPWQFDYLITVFLFGALLLPQEWGPVALWAMDNPIQRLNGKSGFPPAYIGFYEFLTGPNMPQGGDPNNFPFSYKPAAFYANWKDAFDAHAALIIASGSGWNMTAAQMKSLQADPLGGGDIVSWDPYPTHTLRSLMAAADHLDTNKYLDIRTPLPDFDLCYSRVTSMDQRWEKSAPGNFIPSRVSIMSGAVAPPPPVQPPPSNPPPTPGVINMSLNGSLFVGQSENFALTFKDASGADLSPPADLAVKASPDGIVTLAGDTVTAVAPGAFTIDITGSGFSPATLSGKVSPLGIIMATWV